MQLLDREREKEKNKIKKHLDLTDENVEVVDNCCFCGRSCTVLDD